MKGQALVQIKELVEEFIKNEDYYNNTKYKEAEARIRFIDPFFEALGWDISGKTAETPSEREVIIERSFDNEDETKKFVDYTFRINQKPQFLVEAKKPSEKLTNKKHIFQAKSYGFSMGVPFVILTNFKKMRLYDISTKPLMNQPKTDLVDAYYLELNQYEEKFEYIWNLFSKEAVQNKSLIKYYMERRNLEEEEIRFNLNYANYKGSSLLDKEFLNDLLDWRLLLAKNIYKNNSELEQNKINELVQRCLDRVVFLR
ncbi:MAG: type I restriction endonuclease, partial [archaeon]